MDDPDVILRVHRHADRRAEQPVVGERLRPHRIDLEARRLRAALRLRIHCALDDELTDPERDNERDERTADPEMTL